MYAIIETGGKQYRVAEGDTVDVELLGVEAGQVVELDRVLLASTDDGVLVGKPTVEGVAVRAHVVDTVKGQKVVVFKYKPKNRYRRKTGHRQKYTRLRIDEIVVPGAEEASDAEIAEPAEETQVVEGQPATVEAIADPELTTKTDDPEAAEELTAEAEEMQEETTG